MTGEAMIIRHGVLDVQVCVPSAWTDEQVESFANGTIPCGTTNGWIIRRQGDKLLAGDQERTPCEEREGFVHIMLDA